MSGGTEGRVPFIPEPLCLDPRPLVWVQRVFRQIPANSPASVHETHGCPWASDIQAAGPCVIKGVPQLDLAWFWDRSALTLNPSSLPKAFTSVFPSSSSRSRNRAMCSTLLLPVRLHLSLMPASMHFVNCVLEGKCLGTSTETHSHFPTFFSNWSHCCQLVTGKYL